MKMLFRRPLLAAAVAGLAFSTGPAAAETVMKLTSATINDVQHEWIKVFAEELAASAPEVTTEVYPASQLGTIPRMAEGVLLGTIEAFITPTSFVTNIDSKFQAFDVPGLFPDADGVAKVIHDPEYRKHLEEMFLNKGVRIIGAIYNSPTLLLSREPVDSLDDMQGMKVRTFASPLQMKPMEAVGASPTPLALSEVTPALQSGGLDGMLAGMPILTAFKYYDTAKYVTDLNFSHLVSVTLLNEGWFQLQSDEVKEAIIAAGRAAEEAVFPWGVANVERANGVWIDNGGQILSLPEAEQAELEALFLQVGEAEIADQPEVMAEYERIKALLD